MNITIILPAVQVIKRAPDSPQHTTTPFPPVISATPSCPQSPCTTSEYQEILEEYHRHVKHDADISRVELIAARQAAYDFDNNNFETSNISPTKSMSIEFEEAEEIEEFQIVSRISSSQITTDSPSSPDTVKTVRSPHKVIPAAELHKNGRESSGVYTHNDTR